MKNSCGVGPGLKCLQCEFPPCNCKKCITLRSQGKADQRSRMPRCQGGDTEGDKDSSLAKPNGGFGNMNMPKFSFTPSNLYSMLFDIVGILAFFMMATFMFWITICTHLWSCLQYIYQSGRKTHIVTIVLFTLLVLCTTFHVLQGRHMQECRRSMKLAAQSKNGTIPNSQGKSPATSSPCHKNKCSPPNLQTTNKNANPPISGKVSKKSSAINVKGSKTDLSKGQPVCGKCGRSKAKKNTKSATNLKKKSNSPSLCDLCANEKNAKPPNPVLTDEEVREMYKLSKLYAMPTEMKSPPPSLVHIVDYLSNYYFGTTGSTGNTLPPIT